MKRRKNMIKNTLWVLLLMFGISTATQAQFGLAVGANFDQISDVEIFSNTEAQERRVQFDNATGFHVGVFYDFAVGPLAVRPGLYYIDVGNFGVSQEGLGVNLDYDLSLFEVPIDVRVRSVTPLVKLYAFAGPVLRMASTGDDDVDEALNQFSVAGNIGAGVEAWVPALGVTVMPELRYAFGVSRIMDRFEVNEVGFEADAGQQLNSVMLRLGVMF